MVLKIITFLWYLLFFYKFSVSDFREKSDWRSGKLENTRMHRNRGISLSMVTDTPKIFKINSIKISKNNNSITGFLKSLSSVSMNSRIWMNGLTRKQEESVVSVTSTREGCDLSSLAPILTKMGHNQHF